MNKWTWALYLFGSALVYGSWIGVVDGNLAWVGWVVATGIALQSWLRYSSQKKPKPGAAASPASTFTQQEQESARDEIGRDGV